MVSVPLFVMLYHIVNKLAYTEKVRQHCLVFTLQQQQYKLAAARLKKGTAQSYRPANLARIFINLSWNGNTPYLQ